eukprot:scaffold1883_cov261-Pinguiococcus_pyrenoidosus.AAC.37
MVATQFLRSTGTPNTRRMTAWSSAGTRRLARIAKSGKPMRTRMTSMSLARAPAGRKRASRPAMPTATRGIACKRR